MPPASRALSAALYSFGADGENSTLMSGYCLLKAGMILLFQMSASSLRQLSILSEPACAAASPVNSAARATPPRIHAKPVFILSS